MSQQGRLVDVESAFETLTGNTGGAVSPDGSGDLTLAGTAPIVTTGNPGTNTITISTDGSIGESFPTDSGTAIPAAGALTMSGGTGVGTIGAGSTVTINLDSTVATSYSSDSGSAIAAANILTIVGGTAVSTTGAGSTITVNLSGAVTTSYPTDSGTATPTANALTIAGGTNINTSGAGTTATINLDAAINNVSVGASGASSGDFTSLSGTSITSDPGAATDAFLQFDESTTGKWRIGNDATDDSFRISQGSALGTNDGLIITSAGVPTFPSAALDVASGGTGVTSTTAYTVQCAGTTSTAAFQSIAGVGASGEVLTSNGAGALPTFQAGGGGGGLTWNVEAGTSATMAVDNGYIANNAGLVTFTLPSTAAVGERVRVTGIGAGGWKIAQNAGETIYFSGQATTTGVGGSLASVEDRDAVELLCVVANNDWNCLSAIGNLTIV